MSTRYDYPILSDQEHPLICVRKRGAKVTDEAKFANGLRTYDRKLRWHPIWGVLLVVAPWIALVALAKWMWRI